MKNVKVKVREGCNGYWWDIGLYKNKKHLMSNCTGRQIWWNRKFAAIRNAKKLAKEIGIPYDPEIVKQHGC